METGKPNLTVFCGAGFSVCAGLPTMLSFSHAVRTCGLLEEIEKLEFERIQIACSAMTAMTGASSRNLEDVASLLSVLRLSQPNYRFLGCEKYKTPNQALDLIDVCIRTVFSPLNHEYKQESYRLLSQVEGVSNLSIVTTNYDMHIELGAAHLGATIRTAPWITKCLVSPKYRATEGSSIYDFHGAATPHTTPSNTRRRSFELFKLHGSVNWLAGPEPVVEDRWILKPRTGNAAPYEYQLGVADLTDKTDQRRLLVPPSVVKAEGFGPLAGEWQGAASALAKADAVWFIGYSFPATDSFMRYFLAGALQSNTRVRQVAIIDPCALEIAERTQDLFGSAELADLLEPIPLKWELFCSNMTQFLKRTWTPTISEYGHLLDQLEGRALLRGQLVPRDDLQGGSARARSRRLGR